MFKISSTLNLSRIDALRRAVAADLEGTGNGPLRQSMREAGDIYLDLMQARFMQFSRGGGDWPPLSPITLARRMQRGRINPRRKLTLAKTFSAMNTHMLFDTETLYRELTPGAGYNQRDIRNGVSAGYLRDNIHPATAGIPIAQIARWQHDGTAKIPARRIIVNPVQAGINKIQQTLQTGLDRIVEQYNASRY